MTTETNEREVFSGLSATWAGAMDCVAVITSTTGFHGFDWQSDRARVFRVDVHPTTFPGQLHGWRVIGVRST